MLDEITQAVLSQRRDRAVSRGQPRRERPRGARADRGLSRRAADHAALLDLPRAEAPALPDSAEDRAHRRARRRRQGRGARRAGRSTPRTTAATPTTWSSRWCSTTTASGRRSSPPASICSAARSGCIHRHVTGAIPIRRNTKDPAYLHHAQGVHRRAAAQAATCSSIRKADAATAASSKCPRPG